MENLNMETKNGKVPIDPKIIEKYNIKKGVPSPFTNNPIVNDKGECFVEKVNEKKPLRPYSKTDGIVELDSGMMLSTSEIIDLSQGTDSSNR